jgi:hypothetical protein
MANDGKARKRGPRQVGEFVSSALRDLGLPSRSVSTRLVRAWSMVCEPAWSTYTHVRRYEGGVLEIGVTSAPLREELVHFHQDRLLGLIQTALTELPVVALRFVLDEGDIPHARA